jgi:hypothetical protein
MLEYIVLAAILLIALVFAMRPWYLALTGKSGGCAGCPGGCGCSGSFERSEACGQCNEGYLKQNAN